MQTNRSWLGHALFTAVVFMAGTAQAGIDFWWDYSEAIAELGQSEVVVLHDFQEGLSATAEVADVALGSAHAELEIAQQVNALDVWTVDVSSAIDLVVNEDAGGAINFSHGNTYFQLAVTVSDTPYMFDLNYELNEAPEDFVTAGYHFVCHYGDGPVLYPQAEPYILLWGGMDYTITGFDFEGWNSLCTHAGTTVVLIVTPVPEPASMSLLAVGGLALIRRRHTI